MLILSSSIGKHVEGRRMVLIGMFENPIAVDVNPTAELE